MNAPLIGLSGRRRWARDLPGMDLPSLEGEEVDVHLSEYPKAVTKAGGLPVQLSHDSDPVALVRRLDPQMETARAWLKLHGSGLHRYG